MNKKELRNNLQNVDINKINQIMEDCEIYRDKLIKHCQTYFKLSYEDACDCVQDTYLALYENLLHGIKISNYKGWLYKVALNYNNKIIREKLKRNEYDFFNNDDKDSAIENNLHYTPDYLENMNHNEVLEEIVIKIISSLNKDERNLYIAHYVKRKPFVEISKNLGLDASTIRKRHTKLKKKILKMIKEYEKS